MLKMIIKTFKETPNSRINGTSWVAKPSFKISLFCTSKSNLRKSFHSDAHLHKKGFKLELKRVRYLQLVSEIFNENLRQERERQRHV